MIQKVEFLDQLAELVALETISANPTTYTKWQIEKALDFIIKNTTKGMEKDLVVKKIKHKDVSSLIISNKSTLRPDIGLNAHIDVAPGVKKLFKMKVCGDKLMGRGVFDMKFCLPIFMALMRQVVRQKKRISMAMLITSDEEIGSNNGAKHLVEDLGYRPRLLFVPDGGDNWKLVRQAKGVLHLKAIFKGKSAHASRPWLGDNAIEKAIEFIKRIRRLYPAINKEKWETTTMNVGIINGGEATNQVPEKAWVTFDFRFTDKVVRQKIIRAFKTNLPPKSEIEIMAEAYIFSINPQEPHIKKFINIFRQVMGKKIKMVNEYGATDARFFSHYGVPCVVLKPSGGGAHSSNEWISLKGVFDYYQMLERFINND